jgi:4-cresol dehydrogenase (hydroxylating) flavoprotein subunit
VADEHDWCSHWNFMSNPRKVFESEVAPWLAPGGFGESLCGHRRLRFGTIKPRTVKDVQRIVWAASRARGAVKLQAFSCGNNWGFGSALAPRHGIYSLDLSQLRTIRSVDLLSHCAELEPGVTQQDLDEALERKGGTHYFNVTGAGLGASVIGNALERGIGYFGQRHLDLLDLEVVLPSGDLSRTSRFDAHSRSAYAGGLGPDPTGLFCQSSFGVITGAIIALHRRCEVMGGIVCRLGDADRLAALVSVISNLIAEGACHGVPHIFNRERILTTFLPHLDEPEASRLKSTVARWTAVIPVRGSRGVFLASAQHLATALNPLGEVEILDDEKGSKLSRLLHGRPSDLGLASVAFSVFGTRESVSAHVEATGAGLIHVTPVLPLTSGAVLEVQELTNKTLRRHGYGAVPLSLNVLSPRAAALIVSIGFDRRSGAATEAAHRAANELLRTYVNAGFLPYRLGLEQGNLVPGVEKPWRKIFQSMRHTFDPFGCMGDSRYEQLWQADGALAFPPIYRRQPSKDRKTCTTPTENVSP